MITVWLWDTDGPRRRQGISATRQDAEAAVEEEMGSGATFGTVELAWLILGPQGSYYEMTGYAATATGKPGSVVWEDFEVVTRRAS